MEIMKICYNCDFENFIQDDFCERCNWNINGIRDETFDIAGFIRRNYQLYAIFGILVGLFTYLFRPEQSLYVKDAGLVPLLIAIYIILHLMNKARLIFISTHWDNFEEIRRRESFFDCIIFYVFHIFLIIALIATIPSEIKILFGFLSGVFIFLTFFSADFSESQHRIVMLMLLISIFCLELTFLLIISIPAVAAFANNEIIAFIYLWGTTIIVTLSTGGLFSYYVVTMIYNVFFHENIQYQIIFQRNVDNQISSVEFMMGIVILFGLILIPILYQIISLSSK